MNKKNIFYWALYDLANSVPVIVFALYFSQWLVVENGISDILFNLIFVVSSFLLIATAPILGAISDQKGAKLPYLRNLTLAMTATILITTFLTLIFPAKSEILILTGIFFTLTNYFYQFSLVFYSALLPQLAPINKRGFISGLGISASWLGQILGLLITLPFASGKIYLFGNPGREQTFLPAVILFILPALPMVFLFKEKVTVKKTAVKIIKEYKNYFKNFKLLTAEKGLGRFLLGYFFFTDAVLTVQSNFAIYLEQVFKINDQIKALLVMAILTTSAIGALVMGWIADKVGLKKTLLIIMAAWIIVFPLLALVADFNLFVVLTIVMGFLFGASYPITRAVMSYLTPEHKLSNAFSFYTLAERFSTFLGPLVWGLVATLLVNIGPDRYRLAILSMTIFIFLGFLILRKIPAEKKY